jgi:hypothetical protein
VLCQDCQWLHILLGIIGKKRPKISMSTRALLQGLLVKVEGDCLDLMVVGLVSHMWNVTKIIRSPAFLPDTKHVLVSPNVVNTCPTV